jgi:hypothetical protein
VNFIMLHPSPADDTSHDEVMQRCMVFAQRWGFSGMVITNLFTRPAIVADELTGLYSEDGVGDLIGEKNKVYLKREARNADCVVCAWGDDCDLLPYRDLDVMTLLGFRDLFCIRKTKKGKPAHPAGEPFTDAPALFARRVV